MLELEKESTKAEITNPNPNPKRNLLSFIQSITNSLFSANQFLIVSPPFLFLK